MIVHETVLATLRAHERFKRVFCCVRDSVGAVVRFKSVFLVPLLLVGLTGCGGGAPIVSPQMVGHTGSLSSVRSGSSTSMWKASVHHETRVPQWGTRSRRPVSKYRPKGGGHFKLGKPYQINGKWYYPQLQPDYDKVGLASWYGHDFDGKRTANGEIYDMRALTAAHKTLPLPSYAYVTNLQNNRTVLVRINDRGPFKPGRIIDLSERVSRELGFKHHGLAKVRVRYAGRAPLNGNDKRENAYLMRQSWHRHAAR